VAYLSPEILNKKPYDFQTDVWSLGNALYALLSGRLPFIGDKIDKTIFNIKTREPSFSN
jgi:serine/threonine protein kinase